MVLLTVTPVMPAVLGGHTREPYWVALPVLGLLLLLRVRRARGRGIGPRGPGPGGNGAGGSPQDPPVQWDVRKAPPPAAAPDAANQEQDPPVDT